jgi:hypothetical protein
VSDADNRLRRDAEAAVTRILGKFPELESTNIELLRMLLEYAWVDGVRYDAGREAERIEAELILRGHEL